ncbi:MAG: Phosphatidylserine decarboxylase proenzyme [Alphaproteobacteria bacterium MarineAlpha10_Bin3]|jgi:phosphatidylserine decarboxylase|nr:MAG: Phosphatidylserine decarboxylase proenzyme [Alphaproteobacteria bacterium MarineAlpha10_Bin3]PPR75526.1 MAG: Phosphatidylserine decarboxylase proenzyme [Alphaproteobacteria bacterium MarineAlpha4_Bin1]
MLAALTSVFVPIHRAGWPFIALFVAIAVILGWVWPPLLVPGGLLAAWCVYFFRDPARVTPVREGLIVSPADGVVQMIEQVAPPAELDMGPEALTRVSIFMNVFSVHVNRIPADGAITGLSYRPGKFFNASLDKASVDNERQSVRMTTTGGQDIAFVQIAGLIARRILCHISVDQRVRAGERFGMIRFGSRVDVYLPKNVAPLVRVGQISVAGETVLADCSSGESNRKGEQR